MRKYTAQGLMLAVLALSGCNAVIPINERVHVVALISKDLGIDGVVVNWDVQLPDPCKDWHAACTLSTYPQPVFIRPSYGTTENLAHELRHVWQFRQGMQYQQHLPYYERPMEVDAYSYAVKWR